jgi:hypothetical protein
MDGSPQLGLVGCDYRVQLYDVVCSRMDWTVGRRATTPSPALQQTRLFEALESL